MKNLIIFITLLQFLANTSVIDAQCTTTLTCLHSGQFNSATCKCDCFPNYSGTYCETVNCVTADPSACGVYITPDQCTGVSIPDYCPRLCNVRGCTCSNGIDQCLNGGTFNSNTCTCSCPSGFTGTVCQTVSNCQTQVCQNSGSFNSATCKCDCFPNYSGNLCETLDCTVADSSYCVSFSLADCNSVMIVRSYCPNKCGRCLATTASTSPSTTTIIEITVTQQTLTPASTSTTTASTSTASTSTASTSTASTSTASTSTASTSTASTSTASTSTASTSTASTSTASTSTSTASTSTASTSTASTSTASTSTASTSTASTSTASTSTASTSTASTSTASTSTASTSTASTSTASTSTASTSTASTSTASTSIASTTTASTTTASTTTASTTTASTSAASTSTVSTSSGSTTACQPLTCQNGFIFNVNTCSCPCSTGFSGTLCETYDCTLSPTVDSQLNGLCDTVLTCNTASAQCPFKCLCGGTTGAPTTSGPSTSTATPTTSVVTSCQPLACQNGFIFNTNTCSCPCGTGFSGNLCQTYNCALTPTVDSQLNGLCDTVLTCPAAQAQCPFKCLCGGTTMA